MRLYLPNSQPVYSAERAVPLSREGRTFQASKHAKALRRYGQEILRGNAKNALNAFMYLDVPLLYPRYRWDHGRKFMFGFFVTRSSIAYGAAGEVYRVSQYGGNPDYYADPTRSLASNGTGTLLDPWNLDQAKANAIAGDVVGLMESGSSAVQLATTNNDNIPAFNPTADGTALSRIVFVTKYAAVSLSGVDTNANRTEIKHNGTAPSIVGGVGAGTGCAAYGSNASNYITYDGIYTDMATAYMKEDSGVLRVESATGVHFRNFVVKGATLTVASNPIVYRPQDATDTILSNFRVYDFDNDPTGSATPQQALFSDQYGDQNFTVEFFEITNTERGGFIKGSGFGGALNYGTYRYGKFVNLLEGFRVNGQAVHASNNVNLQYVQIQTYTDAGIHISNETGAGKNVVIDHVTVCDGSNNINQNGPFYQEANNSTGISVTNSIFDVASGTARNINCYENLNAKPTFDYNGYYRGGAACGWSHNATNYGTLADWRASAGTPDVHGIELATDPFTNRAGGVFTIAGGHAAKTASSTGGELGAYGGSYVPGVQV